MAQSYEITEEFLNEFRPIIGNDFMRYKNHVDRVFLLCLKLDDNKENLQKYAIAAVYHDIGIWTHQTIDYLEPSISKAKEYLIKIDKAEWIEEVSAMIHWHHKTSRYTGKYTQTVETFRKADWIDVTLGFLRHKIPANEIKEIKKQFPNLGFHWFLVKKVAKNLLKHPLNPLPMFTK